MTLTTTDSSIRRCVGIPLLALTLLHAASCSGKAEAEQAASNPEQATELSREQAQLLMQKTGMSFTNERILDEMLKAGGEDATAAAIEPFLVHFDFEALNEKVTRIVMEKVRLDGALSAIEFYSTEQGALYLESSEKLARALHESSERHMQPLIDAAREGRPLPDVWADDSELPAPGTDAARLQEKIDRIMRLGIAPELTDAEVEAQARGLMKRMLDASGLPEDVRGPIETAAEKMPTQHLRDAELREVFADEANVDAVLAWSETEAAKHFLEDMRAVTAPMMMAVAEHQQSAMNALMESVRRNPHTTLDLPQERGR